MAEIVRHTVTWTGSPGLPGYSQFYTGTTGGIPGPAAVAQAYLGAMFDELSTIIPEEVTITVDPVYQVIHDATGVILSEGTIPSPVDPMEGTYVGDWARQVGALVEWTTGLFIGGRSFRGRTYLVPLGGTTATDGTLADGPLESIRAAAAILVGSGSDFRVWHRPVNGAGGLSLPILGAVVRDHAAVLRSRMV